MDLVPGRLLVISIGTTAPFAAICGASMMMSLLSVLAATPRPFNASFAVLDWKASLFQAANARSGASRVAARAAANWKVFLRSKFMESFYLLAAVMAGLAAAFFLEAQFADDHAAVHGLDHVVDGEQADGGGAECFHFHAGAAAALDRRGERDLALLRVEAEIRVDARERDRVRERNQLRGALGRLDRRDARDAEHVALGRAAFDHHAEGRRPHRDAARRHSDPVCLVLGAHVHHAGAALAVEMRQLRRQLASQSILRAYILIQGTQGSGRYHNCMRFPVRLLSVALVAFLQLTPRAFGQDRPLPSFRSTEPAPQPTQQSARLPDLGDAGTADLPLATERRIGETIMRDIRRDPSYLDDPEVAEYVNGLGTRLTSSAPGARQDFEFFVIRDAAINAFALPGGFIGINSGLITVSDNEAEVASVM